MQSSVHAWLRIRGDGAGGDRGPKARDLAVSLTAMTSSASTVPPGDTSSKPSTNVGTATDSRRSAGRTAAWPSYETEPRIVRSDTLVT